MGSNHEKNGGRKSRDTLPLRQNSIVWFTYSLYMAVYCLMTAPGSAALSGISVCSLFITLFSSLNNAALFALSILYTYLHCVYGNIQRCCTASLRHCLLFHRERHWSIQFSPRHLCTQSGPYIIQAYHA